MNVVTVSQINEYIKRRFDSDYALKSVAVSGEISNYNAHYTGHSYFSLKDKDALINATMFKGSKTSGLAFTPKDGMKVIAMGYIGAYPKKGEYRLYVSKLVLDGVGDLFIAYEELKNKLREEGLFDESLKRPLPRYPERIGVITSETGAVLHDIKNVLSRRYPIGEIVLYPAKVQGEGGAESMIDALFKMNEEDVCDVAIIARGGGSIEDLWEFNSEALARAIRASHIPVISAVGHETDFTICDFASDLRAPTPSAAAELAAPSTDDIRMRLDSFAAALDGAVLKKVDAERKRLTVCRERMSSAARSAVFELRLALEKKNSALLKSIDAAVAERRLRLKSAAGRVELLSPLQLLSRGYSITESGGKRISSAAMVNKGDKVRITFSDGAADAVITEVEK